MGVSNVNFPNVLLREVGLFLVARELLRLSQVCRHVWEGCENIIIPLARHEQQRMRLQIVPFSIRLTLSNVVERWRHLAPSVARAVREALGCQPLVFYSRLFDPGAVLLAEATLAVRHNSESLSIRAIQEKHIRSAVILARSISNAAIRSLTLRALALRYDVRLLTAFGIARSISNPAVRSVTLRALAQRDNVPFEKALKIVRSIPIETIRSAALKDLALMDAAPFEIALEIARSIPSAAVRSALLNALACRNGVIVPSIL